MAYRVCLSEGFIRPLPARIRSCIRGELARVAEMAEKLPPSQRCRAGAFPVRSLPEGYWISYQLDERARTVRLMVIAQPKKVGLASALEAAASYSAPMNG